APDRSVARPPRGASRRVIGIPRGAAELDHPTAIVIGPPRVSLRSWTLVAVVCLSANVAGAGQWRLNERGECVREWTPSSLARGPLAMVNALTYPPRQLVGGGQAATAETSRSTGELILLTPTMALLGLGTGTMECVFVLGMGIADTITGG